MKVDIVYLSFALCALAVFWRCRPPVAALIVFLGGWIVLPTGHYPPNEPAIEFPYWITGLAVPSEMLLTKAWVAPAAALLGAIVFDHRALLRLRPAWVDLPIAVWCVWPLLQGLATPAPQPAGWLASLYLTGTWGLPWLLGRAYCGTREGQLLLVKGLVLSAAVCLPFSLIEGVAGPMLYGVVYEPHPFRLDGDVRYVGFRPIGFFEHGNQFGLWLAMSALGALWLARTTPPGRERRLWQGAAALVTVMTIVAQSVGGILMLGMGAGFLWACGLLRPRFMAAAVMALLIAGGAVYVSGVVPITHIGKDTALGRRVVDVFRAAGRGSFTWRISQDQKLLPDAMARPLVGSAQWDWWRPRGIRPWGLTVLMLGQFGLLGLGASLGALLWPALREAWRATRSSGWRPQALPLLLATIIMLTVFDALLNSFIFFPALVLAGGLAVAASAPRRPRGEITRIPTRRTS